MWMQKCHISLPLTWEVKVLLDLPDSGSLSSPAWWQIRGWHWHILTTYQKATTLFHPLLHLNTHQLPFPQGCVQSLIACIQDNHCWHLWLAADQSSVMQFPSIASEPSGSQDCDLGYILLWRIPFKASTVDLQFIWFVGGICREFQSVLKCRRAALFFKVTTSLCASYFPPRLKPFMWVSFQLE